MFFELQTNMREIHFYKTSVMNAGMISITRAPVTTALLDNYAHGLCFIVFGYTGVILAMGLFPDTYNCGLRMRRECRHHFPHHWLQRKPLVSDAGMHHGTWVTHVPWCMLGSLAGGGREKVPGIPGACATRNFTYLARGPWTQAVRRCITI